MYNPSGPRRRIVTRVDAPNRLKTSWFQPTNETMRQTEIALSHMFFLVKQGDSFGERLKCVECGSRHDYITLKCIWKPITGLANGLYAYYRVIQDFHLESELDPAELSRFEEVNQVLLNMPDLGKVHPRFARELVKQIGPSDMQMGALSLGVLVPISPTEAQNLAEKINDKGIRPRFELGIPTQAEIDRAFEYTGPKFSRNRW